MKDSLESFGKAVEERTHIELPLAQESIQAGFPASMVAILMKILM